MCNVQLYKNSKFVIVKYLSKSGIITYFESVKKDVGLHYLTHRQKNTKHIEVRNQATKIIWLEF